MVLMVFTEVTGLREADEFLEMLFEKSPSLSVYWKSREKISQIFRNLSCIALPAVCYSLSWRKKKLHIHFLQFFRGPLTQHLKVRFFPQPNLEWRLPIIRFSDSTTEYYTLRSECETSLGRYQTRAGRDSFSVQRNSTLIVFRTVLVWNSLSKFKASNLIRFLLLSLLGWCVE